MSITARPRFIGALVLALLLALSLGLAGCGGDDGADTDTGTDTEADAGGGDATADITVGDVPAPPEGVAQVVLAWDEPVDMDLELWGGDGQQAVTSAGLENEDVMDGTEGSEYLDLTGDYADGEYVVSVYFAEEEEVVGEADVLLQVTMSDGATTTRDGTVYWEPGRDQWHAFRIDAATGGIEDVDEYVEVEIQE